MKKAKLVVNNFDARIPNIKIKPRNNKTKIIISSIVYDEKSQSNKKIKLVFSKVAAIDFRINYFDNMIGAEGMGLYKIKDEEVIRSIVKGIFERRKEIYLLEGDYDYDEKEEADLLNVLDLQGNFEKDLKEYKVYIQNVDAGVYIIVAKNLEIIE